MLKKIGLLLFAVIWLMLGIYIALPAPNIAELPNSYKSTEPGDTVQVPGVSAYYNNQSREQVMAFYKQQFCCSTIAGIPLPTLDLNEPPQDAQIRIRDQLQAWYLEELVHPFRESLYVSGWTPALAQESLGIKESPIVVDAINPPQIFYQKTTIRTMPTSLPVRLGVYVLMTCVLVAGWWLGQKVWRMQGAIV